MRIVKTLYLAVSTLMVILLSACADTPNTDTTAPQPIGTMPLDYATQYSVDYYEGGYSTISIADGEEYVLVPEGKEVPEWVDGSVTVIYQPVDNLYVSASSSMDLLDQLNALDTVAYTSTKLNDWSLTSVREAIQRGDIAYIGKYNAPDYETLLASGCKLSIASTMLYHNPEVKEMLESQGISVLVERSSYESHPLGRFEWVKLYGLLLNRLDLAEDIFTTKEALLDDLSLDGTTNPPTVAFFYVTSNGSVNVRKPNDYVAKMVEMAGGTYAFTNDDLNLDENALSTVNLQFETFYAYAMDADVLIYNSTVDGNITTVQQLIDKNPLFADFKAVRVGNVWCTQKNVFQESSAIANIVVDFNRVFNGETDFTSEYVYRLTND